MSDEVEAKMRKGDDADGETLALTMSRVERRPGRLVLSVVEGPTTGERKVLIGRRVTLGRCSAADLVMDDPSVSALHAEILVREWGAELQDLGSLNGTLVNGRRAERVELLPGDRIQLGEYAVSVDALEDVEVDRFVRDRFGPLLGGSDAMRELFSQLEKLAAASIDVLVLGETGTGKELVAEVLHARSGRSEKPFRVLNCGCLPPTLAESAMFGHAKGAFTGAEADSPGLFEEADGGVVFVDEVGELPLEMQVKLLRVLDKGEFSRVGDGGKMRQVDVRIVSATHRDLTSLVAKGVFREDLYYRLARSRVEVPPLRDRPDDIELLARSFLSDSASLASDAVTALREHSWPGNVRELRNAIEHAQVFAEGAVVRASDLRLAEQRQHATMLGQLVRLGEYQDVHDGLDRMLLPRVLSENDGKIARAAKKLGITPKRLRNNLKRLGLYEGLKLLELSDGEGSA